MDNIDVCGDFSLVRLSPQYMKIDGVDVEKALYSIYSATDFREKVEQAKRSNDLNDMLILCAIWQEIATLEDREWLMVEIFSGILGDYYKPDITTPGVKVYGEDGVLSRCMKKIFPVPSKDIPDILRTYLATMIVDYYLYGHGLIFRVPTVDSDDYHYRKIFDFKLNGDLTLVCWLEKANYTDENINIWEKWARGLIEKERAIFDKFDDEFYRVDTANIVVFVDILSAQCGSSKWKCSGAEIEKANKILGERNRILRLDVAIRNNDIEEIASLANEHFYPAYHFAADNYFKEGKYEEAAYFKYLCLRHPSSYMKILLTPINDRLIRAAGLPESKRFIEFLLMSKRYDEMSEFAYYIETILTHGEYPTAQNLEVLSEIDGLNSYVSREILRRTGKSRTIREINCKDKPYSFGYFSIPGFEKRYQKELSCQTENK
ncbi:MAG: hypothetical protein LUC24_04965 [Bacteroidales bacterium]|nr:hypothetical protein [Bacteroidales bacterium]MCD8313493.1 hypothetical protein [Bacteroidales bacterium]